MTMMETCEPVAAREYPISARRICDIPREERPRELVEEWGVDRVNDRVLLAVILRSGIPGQSVVDLADSLLQKYGSLRELSRQSVDELCTIRGMGRVRAQAVVAALELGRRLMRQPEEAASIIRTPGDAANLMRGRLHGHDAESFWVLMLDTKYRLRRPPFKVSSGILDACLVHPREVFKEAIRACSAAVVLVHNHPSGDPTPSAEDIRLTRRLVEAGRVVEIEVLDHVIIGQAAAGRAEDFISLRESGLVEFRAS